MRQLFRPNIIDVEASGFGQYSYPIEIGLALTAGKRYCSLIFPALDWTYWDGEAEKVHCVTRDLLIQRGRPIQDIAWELNDLLENTTIYSDGWVVDKPWVTRLFDSARVPQRFFISPIETLLTEPQMDIWHQTKENVINELNLKRHRASADALIIQETFVRTLTIIHHQDSHP
ncbi:MAG: hypothetical protein V1793_09030 [Pseudomonadota bacterium]